MMYRGKPGTGTPLMDLAHPPAEGPILGYSREFIANSYTYARNDPVNLVDPSGLEPEFMTQEWFQWFVRWNIPSYKLERDSEWNDRLTREADELFSEVDAVATKAYPDLPTAEARKQAYIAIRVYNERQAAQSGSVHVDPIADPGQARLNASTAMEESMIIAGEGWLTRKFHMFMIPGTANPNPVNLDTTLAAVAAVRVAQVGISKGAAQTPLSPNSAPKGEPKPVATHPRPPSMTGSPTRPTPSNDAKHLKKHLPDTAESRNLIRKDGKAHVFNDEATLRRVEKAIFEHGEFTGVREGYERYGLRFDKPIGYRIDGAGAKVPLTYAEMKLVPATGKYHVIPRTGPANPKVRTP